MSKVILDASVLLALINDEPGAEIVTEALPNAIISTVNFSEVATVLRSIGIPVGDIQILLEDLLKEIVPFDEKQALIAADLREKTKHKGLSLGDRACLALGLSHQLPILTADKAWTTLQIDLNIRSIR